jgi:hypothetical protein
MGYSVGPTGKPPGASSASSLNEKGEKTKFRDKLPPKRTLIALGLGVSSLAAGGTLLGLHQQG